MGLLKKISSRLAPTDASATGGAGAPEIDCRRQPVRVQSLGSDKSKAAPTNAVATALRCRVRPALCEAPNLPPAGSNSAGWQKAAALLFAFFLLLALPGCAVFRGAPADPEETTEEVASARELATQEAPEEAEPPRPRRSFWDILFFWRKQPDPIPAATAPRRAGRITLVNLPLRFVVIETPSGLNLAPGTLLGTAVDGTIASRFLVSRERRPPFFIAEIVDGTPDRGDSVVILETAQPAPEAVVAEEESVDDIAEEPPGEPDDEEEELPGEDLPES